jgi:glycosyltransferase involved in cell wall biosynthesis
MRPGTRIGLNLLYLVPGKTGGMETYAGRLVPAMAAARPDLRFIAFLNREAFEVLGPNAFGADVRVVRMDASGSNRAARVAAEQLRLPRVVRREGVEVLHSLGSTAPAKPGVTSVVTIHDLIYARYPEAHTAAMRWGMRILVPLSARSAKRIIAGTRFAAEEIVEILKVPRERIDVVNYGGLPPGPATPETELRSRLELGEGPIVLSVSARRPHKNLDRLLQAIAKLESTPRPVLVLPGYSTPFEAELRTQIQSLGIGDRVRVLGWISDADLEGLYRLADCFVFPSLAEGFGLPVLEAMERGVPVACSRASALPEVAGDAARYFDPLSVEDIRAAIDEVLSDRDLRARLVAAGKARAAGFSWDRAAEETIEVYGRALDGLGPAMAAGGALPAGR